MCYGRTLKLYYRSGSRLLSSLVSVVSSIALNDCIPEDTLYERRIDILAYENLRLSVLLFVKFVLLPSEQVQCDKGVWATWIETGRALVESKMLSLNAPPELLTDSLLNVRLLWPFTS